MDGPVSLQANSSGGKMAASAGKYLTFKLANEVYGLEILKVQEIIGIMNVTSIPRTPDFIRGVINLRGKIIPVIDLRLKFGMLGQESTDRTCIIVVQISLPSHKIVMGLLVDEVSEVLDISQNQIDAPPAFGASVNVDFILGMGKLGQKVVILLDIDKVLSVGEMEIMVQTVV
jgi:purine-binding chemotaxis protein CheW